VRLLIGTYLNELWWDVIGQPNMVAGDKELVACGVHLLGLDDKQHGLAVPHRDLKHRFLVRG